MEAHISDEKQVVFDVNGQVTKDEEGRVVAVIEGQQLTAEQEAAIFVDGADVTSGSNARRPRPPAATGHTPGAGRQRAGLRHGTELLGSVRVLRGAPAYRLTGPKFML